MQYERRLLSRFGFCGYGSMVRSQMGYIEETCSSEYSGDAYSPGYSREKILF
ncbi:MAG: hypothetical protein HPY74_12655 [Firmicutes bacterium]|nr:hypothetical protein [Bacillota bacterium]